ncbi:MAG: OsmC family protein [Candidatus Tectomicrobia bacterium]|uniref:OsmC family protein n=1 Tax=Tectimicrobiota bacterium TaxID=2528274 RepID=A0A932MNA1_UNCTE|nr:OsmC family protein [Candidatus Tectomicrobia bacterium]
MANTTDTVMAKQERRVRAQWKGNCKVELKARSLAWMADEPKAAGGEDAGPTPREMALGALAACVTIVTHKVAEDLKFRYSDQSIEVRGTADPRGAKDADNGISPNFDHVQVKITLVTDEPEERVAELKRQHKGRCPISALFRESGCGLEEEWIVKRP